MTIQINTSGNLSLVVAWGSGTVSGRHVKTGGTVETELRAIVDAVVSTLGSGHAYAPDVDMEDDTHLIAERKDLLDTDLVKVLEQGPSLPIAADQEIRSKRLSCHAVHLENGPDRAVFVRARNPVALATKSLLGRFVSGAVTKIEEPIFGFDARFDVILAGDEVYVLNKKQFERLFRDSDAVLKKAPDWIDTLAEVLPISTESSKDLLDDLRRNSFHRAKFHAVLQKPYLKNLSIKKLGRAMKAHDLDPAILMPGGELDFSTSDNVRDILRLLNEDLYFGDFSDDQYAASAKRRLP